MQFFLGFLFLFFQRDTFMYPLKTFLFLSIFFHPIHFFLVYFIFINSYCTSCCMSSCLYSYSLNIFLPKRQWEQHRQLFWSRNC
jgi:hypothetical protein